MPYLNDIRNYKCPPHDGATGEAAGAFVIISIKIRPLGHTNARKKITWHYIGLDQCGGLDDTLIDTTGPGAESQALQRILIPSSGKAHVDIFQTFYQRNKKQKDLSMCQEFFQTLRPTQNTTQQVNNQNFRSLK